jgi:lactoylglutathione lyase
MTLQFRYSGLIVSDVPHTVDFYERAFGFRLRYLHPSSGYAELETGDTLLAFIAEAFIDETALLGELPYGRSRADADTAPPQVVALVSEDLAVDWDRATGAGASVVKLPEAKPWGQTTGYLRDCNGMIVEICTRSPRDAA